MKIHFVLPGVCLCLSLTTMAVYGQTPASAVPPSHTQPAKAAEPPPVPSEEKQPEATPPASKPARASDAATNADKQAGGTKPAGVDKPAGEEKTVAPGDRAPYIIGPQDVLMVKVWQEPNLSGLVTVGPDGMISLQLIDEVKADGLTLEQLKGSLTEKLKSFIVNPDVNIQMVRVNSRKFLVQGEVNRPGSYPLTGPITIMEALVYAQGFKEFANPKKVYILRTEIDPQTKKSETKKYKFNYKDVSHGKHMEQNIQVLNGDQIFVP